MIDTGDAGSNPVRSLFQIRAWRLEEGVLCWRGTGRWASNLGGDMNALVMWFAGWMYHFLKSGHNVHTRIVPFIAPPREIRVHFDRARPVVSNNIIRTC